MKAFLISAFLVLFSVSAFAEPAVVVSAEDCTGFVPDEDGNLTGELIYTNDSQFVITESGEIKVTCHFDDHGADLPYAYGATEFLCATEESGLLTVVTRMVAMPSGKAVLVCKFKEDE